MPYCLKSILNFSLTAEMKADCTRPTLLTNLSSYHWAFPPSSCVTSFLPPSDQNPKGKIYSKKRGTTDIGITKTKEQRKTDMERQCKFVYVKSRSASFCRAPAESGRENFQFFVE